MLVAQAISDSQDAARLVTHKGIASGLAKAAEEGVVNPGDLSHNQVATLVEQALFDSQGRYQLLQMNAQWTCDAALNDRLPLLGRPQNHTG